MNADHVVAVLRARRESVATCESLTGGLVAAELTSVPGASAVVRGGLVTYATELKVSLAGVDPDVVRRFGVVSDQVAQAMAAGARRVCGASWGIAVTGVAGPDEVDGLAPGTVWTAVAGPYESRARSSRYHGDREQVRRATVAGVLDLLDEMLAQASIAR